MVPLACPGKEVLEKVQNRAVRMIKGLRSKTNQDRLKELELLSLEDRRLQTFKII